MVDAPARFLNAQVSWLGNSWSAYLSGPVLFDGWMLYVEMLLSLAAVWGLVRRKAWVLICLGVVLVSATAHWVDGATSPFFSAGWADYYAFAHAALFLITLVLVALVWSAGGLSGRTAPR